eukprot:scaffold267280_cov30-Tisochrysis_lutea.AAC.8
MAPSELRLPVRVVTTVARPPALGKPCSQVPEALTRIWAPTGDATIGLAVASMLMRKRSSSGLHLSCKYAASSSRTNGVRVPAKRTSTSTKFRALSGSASPSATRTKRSPRHTSPGNPSPPPEYRSSRTHSGKGAWVTSLSNGVEATTEDPRTGGSRSEKVPSTS